MPNNRREEKVIARRIVSQRNRPNRDIGKTPWLNLMSGYTVA